MSILLEDLEETTVRIKYTKTGAVFMACHRWNPYNFRKII